MTAKTAMVALLAAGVALAAIVAGTARMRGDDARAVSPAPPTASASDAGVDPEARRLLATPQARAWRSRKAFEREVQAFVRGAPRMPMPARERRADALQARIADEAQAGRLSAGERFLLEAAVLRAVKPKAEHATRLRALAARYRADARLAEARWRAQLASDPRFGDYKRREAEVVAEVMAMSRFPDSLDRDEYLRRRLQAERERAYR